MAGMLGSLLLAACNDGASSASGYLGQSETGRQAIAALGCGSCHAIPGIEWPQGRVGPSLEGFADRGLIAGHLANTPDNLVAFLLDSPQHVPGTGMPRIAMTEQQARDIGAYLLTLQES